MNGSRHVIRAEQEVRHDRFEGIAIWRLKLKGDCHVLEPPMQIAIGENCERVWWAFICSKEQGFHSEQILLGISRVEWKNAKITYWV